MPKRFTPNDEKFVELVLYIATRCADDPTFGATKLNKILFFADFRAYAELGAPITGHRYKARPYGPAPAALVPIVNQMQERGECQWEGRWHVTQTQKRLLALRRPNESLFSVVEIELVDEIVEQLRGQTATELSDTTHDLPGWISAKIGQEIPYETVFVLPPRRLTVGEIERARELART